MSEGGYLVFSSPFYLFFILPVLLHRMWPGVLLLSWLSQFSQWCLRLPVLWKRAVHSTALISRIPPCQVTELPLLPLLQFCLWRGEETPNQILHFPDWVLNVLLVESNFSEVLFVGIFYLLF